MSRLFFEDFAPGSVAIYGPLRVTKEEILSFAREFDPQPFHTDEEAARDSFVGGLIASGWHTCALLMRLVADGFLLKAVSMGSPGVEEARWLRPVRPGDQLRARTTVLDRRASNSRPQIGLVRFRFEMLNAADEVVLDQTNWIMFGRRGASLAAASAERPIPAPVEGTDAVEPSAPPDSRPPPSRGEEPAADSPFLEDLALGKEEEIGSYVFSSERIVRFAKTYDPQPFHVDPEAARHSMFGGLCASGWHTAAVWMKMMIEHRERRDAEAPAGGRRPPRIGPSPGFKNLKWSKPVYAGDTVTYRSTIVDARPSASRPGWGLALHRNRGINQHGAEVFSFEGAVFVEWDQG